MLKNLGFKTKLAKNINSKDFYSAGTPEERADDLNSMFADPEVEAIICATGGITANQILELIDYDLILENPKLLIGYSDNTNLLLSIYAKTGLATIYGPDVCEISNQSDEALAIFKNSLLTGDFPLPTRFEVIKEGKVSGRLVGGYLPAIDGLLASEFAPDFENSILFWETVNDSPAKIDFLLNQFKLSGNLAKISGMIIGHLENCVDQKYPQDNKPIKDIVLEVSKNYDFPIIQVDSFGHEIKNFKCLALGREVVLATKSMHLEIIS